MLLLTSKVQFRNKWYKIQGDRKISLSDALEKVVWEIGNDVNLNKYTIYDENNRQINKGALLQWFTCDKLILKKRKGQISNRTRSRVYTGLTPLRKRHIHFYVSYTHGMKKLFDVKWGYNCEYLRIDAFEGETVQHAIKKDGRINIWAIRVKLEACLMDKTTYFENHILDNKINNKCFKIRKFPR